MKKYSVRKVDQSVVKGYPYSYELNFDTWAELTADMDYRRRYQNSIFHGGGADVFENDVKIGEISNFYAKKTPISKFSLKDFKEYYEDELWQEEEEEKGNYY